MLEVMIAIGILVILSAALITFTFGLAGRRDRLVREGERAATLARVMDRVERLAATSSERARHGEDWLELSGRGVWPAAGRAGVPAGPVGYSGRLGFDKDAGELTWTETSDAGDTVELVVADIEAVLVDRFDDLVTASGSEPPLRVFAWLAPVDRQRPAIEAGDRSVAEIDPAMDIPGLEELELPERPADFVFVVGAPMGRLARAGGARADDLGGGR